MKIFLVLSLLLVVVYGIQPEAIEAIKKHAKEVVEQCKTEIGTTDDDIAPILLHSPPKTEKGKCFLACINKKAGFLDANGKINMAGSYAAVDKLKDIDDECYNKYKQVVDICSGKVHDHDNECDTALAMFECALAENEKIGAPKFDFYS